MPSFMLIGPKLWALEEYTQTNRQTNKQTERQTNRFSLMIYSNRPKSTQVPY